MRARKVTLMPEVGRRSAGKLMAIGASTMTIDQRMPHVGLMSTHDALRTDLNALRRDYQNAMRRIMREREQA